MKEKEAEISRQVELTDKAARWQESPGNLFRFGNLAEQMYDLEHWEAVREERLESDKARLNEIVEKLRRTGKQTRENP